MEDVDDNGVTHEIIKRREAMARGLPEYFTGKPCKYGHLVPRTTARSNCNSCYPIVNPKPKPEPISYPINPPGTAMGKDAFERNEEKLAEEGCELVSAIRGGSIYVLTYLYEGSEYSVGTSGWAQGRRPHLDTNGVPHTTVARYRDIVDAEPDCKFISMRRSDCGSRGAYIVTFHHSRGVRDIHSSHFVGQQGREKRWLPRPPKEPSVYDKYPKGGWYLYMFKAGDQIMYIGKTDNPQTRVRMTHERKEGGDTVWIAQMDSEANRNIMEMYLINYWLPTRNMDGKSEFKTTYDLPVPSFEQIIDKEVEVSLSKGLFPYKSMT